MNITPPTNVVDFELPTKSESNWLLAYQLISSDKVYQNAYDEILCMCKYSEINPPEQDELFIIKNQIVNIFNSNHSIVQQGSNTLVAEKAIDHKGKLSYKFLTIENKKAFYQNLNFTYQIKNDDAPARNKKFNCFNFWLTDLSRNSYQGVVFDPSSKAPAQFLNMWDGFNVEAIHGVDRLDKIFWHLKNVICDGNEENFQYLLAWLSQIFQKPDEKTGVCLALKSEGRGTGKSSLVVILERLLGHHLGRIGDSKHLLGNFNGHLANKLLVAIEESFWSGSAKDAGKFRTMITEGTITIESKHKDAIEIDSYHRFILLTNNEWVVPATKDERRFFVLLVNELMKQNKEYFDELYQDINDPDVIGQLLNFFLNFDISSFDLRKAKATEEYKNQIRESMQPEEDWLRQILEEGYIKDSYGSTFELKENSPIPKSAFYDDYIRYCQTLGITTHNIKTAGKLGELIVKVIQPIDTEKKARIEGRKHRVNCYVLILLEDMQSRFNEYYCLN